jgi:hypothetical protein
MTQSKRIVARRVSSFVTGVGNAIFYVEDCNQEKDDRNYSGSFGCKNMSAIRAFNVSDEKIIIASHGIQKHPIKHPIKHKSKLFLSGALDGGGSRFERFFQGVGKFECPYCGKKLKHAETMMKQDGVDGFNIPRMKEWSKLTNEWWV